MLVGPLVGHTFVTAGVERNSITQSSCIELPESKEVATITKEVATITNELATLTKKVATITKLF